MNWTKVITYQLKMMLVLSFFFMLVALVGGSQAANTTLDCSEFQVSHKFEGIPLSLDFVVTTDDSPTGGVFKAQMTYEGQGYVAAGFSSDGRMYGALAVIGLPDEPLSDSNPGKYDLGLGASIADQQTIFDSDIVQNDTHTVLTFSKHLIEPDEIELVAPGSNYVLVAAGPTNQLGPHIYRASVSFYFQPCGQPLSSDASVPAVSVEFDDKKSLYKAHGILAAIAWGVLVPLAISNSLCRHLIPGQGVWYQLHRGLNTMVLLLTIVSFALVVKAMNDTSGDNFKHFQPREDTLGKHHTVGLVVMILVIVQSIAGVLRPHVPGKGEKPSAVRVMWEYGHRLCGMALLGMGWYQCYSGLVLYSVRFVQNEDYTEAFWAVTVTIMALGIVGKIHGIMTLKADTEEEKEKDVNDSDSDPNTATKEFDLVDTPAVQVGKA